MHESKYNVRRRIAKTSFAMIIMGMLLTFGAVLFGDDGTATRLTAASGIICMILGCFVSIILGYMGITHHADHTEMKAKSND